eukprot:gene21913-27990_t
MLDNEVRFLYEVFRRSPERNIDLTGTLFLALDVAQQTIFRVMKHRLGSGATGMVTRTAIAQHSNQWVYSPVRELIRMSSTSGSVGSNYSHIHIDFSRRSGKGGYTLLMKAVQYRLYGLLSVLTAISTESMLEALGVAVANGDDLAVALLIRLDVASGSMLSGARSGDIAKLVEHARSLGFAKIQHRLESVYAQHLLDTASNDEEEVSSVSLATQANAINEKIEVFNDYSPAHPLSFQRDETLHIGVRSGYEDSGLKAVSSSSHRLRECVVDRVRLSDLSAERFRREYVERNKPVVILTDTDEKTQDETESIWTLDNLLAKYGSIDILASTIPYATLFGHKEVAMTLKDFVQKDRRGLKPFTAMLQRALAFQFADLSVENVVRILSEHFSSEEVVDQGGATRHSDEASRWRENLPLYIFSGHNQKLNKKLTKDIMKTIRQCGSASNQTGLMVQLLAAVSPGGNNNTIKASSTTTTTPPPSWRFQFFLGPALSGAPLHNHAPAFNFLMRGRKVWTVLPPGRDVYSSLHPIEWAAAGGVRAPEYPYLSDVAPVYVASLPVDDHSKSTLHTTSPCEIHQKEGEVVFVPRHYSHQVLNLAETVGFAVEIEDYAY